MTATVPTTTTKDDSDVNEMKKKNEGSIPALERYPHVRTDDLSL